MTKKIYTVLLSIVVLLAGLPMLHAFLAFLSIAELTTVPTAGAFFYLFTIPAWAVCIMVFVLETFRRDFLPAGLRISNTQMLGLMGMIAPAAALAISPVGREIGLLAFAGISALGLLVGVCGGIFFNLATGWLSNKDITT